MRPEIKSVALVENLLYVDYTAASPLEHLSLLQDCFVGQFRLLKRAFKIVASGEWKYSHMTGP